MSIRKKIVIHEEPEGAVRIGSVRTFLDEMEKIKRENEFVLFFRGHSNFSYKLKPSIYREHGWIKNEDILFKELILRCPDEFGSSDSTFQALVKMQHYSLPTRLLDITTNPLIALFFSCSKGNIQHENGEVVVLRIPKIEIKYFDSDVVSVISNISRRPGDFSLPNERGDIEAFNNHRNIRLLLHEIKKEKPYFEPLINPHHLQSVVCVKPKLNNARIIRQDGAFMLFGVDEIKTNPATLPLGYMATTQSRRILINKREKHNILRQLEAFGITKGSIYPEIERVAEHIKSIYKSEMKS